MSWHPYVRQENATVKIVKYESKGVMLRISKNVLKKYGYGPEYKFIAFAYDPELKRIGFEFLLKNTQNRDKNAVKINSKSAYGLAGFCRYFNINSDKIQGSYEVDKEFDKSAYTFIQLKNEE